MRFVAETAFLDARLRRQIDRDIENDFQRLPIASGEVQPVIASPAWLIMMILP